MTLMNREDIKKILPHREPFLFVDEVLKLEPGKKAICLFHVKEDDFWVPGHFPEEAVMPGVLQVEALAQAGGIAVLSMPEHKGKIAYFGSVDKVKFRGKVVPGDTLRLEVELLALRSRGGKGLASAYRENDLVCSCELFFMFGK